MQLTDIRYHDKILISKVIWGYQVSFYVNWPPQSVSGIDFSIVKLFLWELFRFDEGLAL